MAVNPISNAPRAAPVGGIAPVADAAGATASAVSWAAVFAGGIGALATSIILLELGMGLGFASTSAWPNSGASLATLGVMGGVWLILTQWIASGIGGYLAGRLRTKWTALHTDEVFFRDTAHGFLAWALGTVMMVLLLAFGGSSTLNASSRVAANPAAAQMASNASPSGTLSPTLPGTPAQNGGAAGPAATSNQAAGNNDTAAANPPSDQTRQAADQARKAAAFGSIATALAMVVGAFIASVTGALGGKLRDEY